MTSSVERNLLAQKSVIDVEASKRIIYVASSKTLPGPVVGTEGGGGCSHLRSKDFFYLRLL